MRRTNAWHALCGSFFQVLFDTHCQWTEAMAIRIPNNGIIELADGVLYPCAGNLGTGAI